MSNAGPVVVLLLVSGMAGAQAPTRFVGDWVRVDSVVRAAAATAGDAAFRIGDMGSGWGTPLTIGQDDRALLVEYPHFANYDLQPRVRLRFLLDGSESVNRIGIGHETVEQRSRAEWRGASLLITTRQAVPPGVRESAGTSQFTLTIGADGALLLETVRAGAQRPDTVRTAWRRR